MSAQVLNLKTDVDTPKLNWRQRAMKNFKREKQLWIISMIALVWVGVFAYAPMYGLIYSFFDYFPGKSLFDCEFVGFKYFIEFFTLPDVGNIIRNTLVISGLNMTIGFFAPIALALLINELKNTYFKKFVQTVSYLPHFISWVVVASLIFTILGTEGVFNEFLIDIGFIDKPIDLINDGTKFWGLLVGSNIWKGIGWGSIIYIAAIAGIDQEQYQAAAVDGLGRFGMIRHITIPAIMPTIVLLFILNVGGILSAGFEQQLLLGTPATKDYYEVIDTYVYRYGVQLGRYSFATAVGLMKSIIGIVLVFGTNKIAKKLTDLSIF